MVRIRPSIVAFALIAACVGIVLLLYGWRWNQSSKLAELAARMPANGHILLYVDTARLRQAGLLDVLMGPEAEESPEYREFVRRSGFNYRSDMDAVLAAFGKDASLFLVRGRFRWGQLYEYAGERGAGCENGFCVVAGGVPERRISFFAVTPGILAMASSRDRGAARRLAAGSGGLDVATLPSEPVWLMMSGPEMQRASWLPTGMRSVASALAEAEQIVLAIGPGEGQDFEARATVRCATAEAAEAVTTRMRGVTELLASLIRREGKEPNPADLSGVLSSGAFDREDIWVRGRWRIRRELVDSLASGVASGG